MENKINLLTNRREKVILESIKKETKQLLDEGLIRTFHPQNVKKIISKKYGLNSDSIFTDYKDTTCLIGIELPHDFDKNIIGNIKHDMNVMGYYYINKQIDYELYDNQILLVFEPKFTKNISDQIRNNYRYVYHAAPSIYVDKIKKTGLVPKSKNHYFNYPDRIYLMLGDYLNAQQKLILKNVKSLRNNNITITGKNNNTYDYSVIKIDISKLPDNIDFFLDPNAPQAIFTTNNIPPSAIVEIKPMLF